MPLQKIIISPQNKLYLWNITENREQLLSLFSSKNKPDYLHLYSVKHQKQLLAKQLILKHLKLNHQLKYLETGKPFLQNNNFISISHSQQWVGIVISKQPIGLDIEITNPTLFNIFSKFVHPHEKTIFDIHTLTDLLFLWTAKESTYKLIGQKGLSFKKDILIQEFDRQKMKAKILVLKKLKITASFNKISTNFIISLTFYS